MPTHSRRARSTTRPHSNTACGLSSTIRDCPTRTTPGTRSRARTAPWRSRSRRSWRRYRPIFKRASRPTSCGPLRRPALTARRRRALLSAAPRTRAPGRPMLLRRLLPILTARRVGRVTRARTSECGAAASTICSARRCSRRPRRCIRRRPATWAPRAAMAISATRTAATASSTSTSSTLCSAGCAGPNAWRWRTTRLPRLCPWGARVRIRGNVRRTSSSITVLRHRR